MSIRERQNTFRLFSPSRFTLIELLVVIVIITILAGMLLPALHSAKETSKKIACLNCQKQMGLGFQNYTDNFNDYFPIAVSEDKDKNKTYSVSYWQQIMMKDNYLPGRSRKTPSNTGTHSLTLRCPVRSFNESSLGLAWDGYFADFNNTYMMNSVMQDWGGGLHSTAPGVYGCKRPQIKQPSKFIILCEKPEARDFGFTVIQSTTFQSYKYFHSFANPLTTASEYSQMADLSAHGRKDSNYLYADGHAGSLDFRTVIFRMFTLNSSWADKPGYMR